MRWLKYLRAFLALMTGLCVAVFMPALSVALMIVPVVRRVKDEYLRVFVAFGLSLVGMFLAFHVLEIASVLTCYAMWDMLSTWERHILVADATIA